MTMKPKLMLLIPMASTITIIHACFASEAFSKNEIVPDVLDIPPMHSLEASNFFLFLSAGLVTHFVISYKCLIELTLILFNTQFCTIYFCVQHVYCAFYIN